MRTFLKLFASTLSLLGALLGAPVQASPAVILTESGTSFDATGWMLGFEFQVTELVRVDSLGAFDSGRNGFAAGVTVGLWEDLVVPKLLATAQIGPGSSASLDGFFRYVDVQDVVLMPDHIYVVGSLFEGDEATSLGTGQGGVGSFDARLSKVSDRSGDSGFELPIGTDGWSQGAWLGANFQLVSSVPEPGSAGLWALGLLAVGLARRR